MAEPPGRAPDEGELERVGLSSRAGEAPATMRVPALLLLVAACATPSGSSRPALGQDELPQPLAPPPKTTHCSATAGATRVAVSWSIINLDSPSPDGDVSVVAVQFDLGEPCVMPAGEVPERCTHVAPKSGPVIAQIECIHPNRNETVRVEIVRAAPTRLAVRKVVQALDPTSRTPKPGEPSVQEFGSVDLPETAQVSVVW
jgi:hypothetical protein